MKKIRKNVFKHENSPRFFLLSNSTHLYTGGFIKIYKTKNNPLKN